MKELKLFLNEKLVPLTQSIAESHQERVRKDLSQKAIPDDGLVKRIQEFRELSLNYSQKSKKSKKD
jgi:hypothetical protein